MKRVALGCGCFPTTYPDGMPRSPLTLAALATAAVDGLDAVTTQPIGSGSHGDFEAALVTDADGRHWIIRIPTTERAEAEQSADLVALRSLSTGIRNRMPFAVSAFAGQVPVGGTRAVVYEFVHGHKMSLDSLEPGGQLASSIGEAIAAIHGLPTSFITDAGLPIHTPTEILRTNMITMDRASATGLVPGALLGRWEAAAEDSALWQFAPSVINGGLSADSLLVSAAKGVREVTGILGWHSLSVDDPARDLFWVLGSARGDAADTVIDAYQQARGSRDRQIERRARLYAELELAKWLLHGVQERSTDIVDDATAMLHSLADRVHGDMNAALSHNTMPVMAVDEVETMLETRRA